MEKVKSINYEIVNRDPTIGSTRLEINIKGEQINYVILNTIRRIILTYIPIYGFTEFIFKKNTTIYNNNYIKLRLKNIPIWGIENKTDIFIQEKNSIEDTYVDDDTNDDIDMDIETDTKKINSSTLKQFTMFVDITSTSKDITTVTTDDAKFYYDEKRIDSPYKIPIALIKLQPSQTITFSAISSLNIEKENAIFSPVSVCFYKQITEKEFLFCIESKGQLSEDRIIEVAIINILEKLKKIPTLLESLEIDNTKNIGEIVLLKEDSTFGNLLTNGLQMHKDIDFAGYNIPHLLEDKVIIQYKIKNKNKIKDIFNDVISYYIDIFSLIKKKI